MNKILTISTLSILVALSGCKNEKPGLQKKSFFSNIKEKYSGKKRGKNPEAIKFADAFKVKDEDMKSFAIDSSSDNDKKTPIKSDCLIPAENGSTNLKSNLPWEDSSSRRK